MWERIYGIYDKQARLILKGSVPFVMCYPNDAVAKREFGEICQQIQQFQKYPDDYALLWLGALNTENGSITPSTDGSITPAQSLENTILTAREALSTWNEETRRRPSAGDTAASTMPPTGDIQQLEIPTDRGGKKRKQI